MKSTYLQNVNFSELRRRWFQLCDNASCRSSNDLLNCLFSLKNKIFSLQFFWKKSNLQLHGFHWTAMLCYNDPEVLKKQCTSFLVQRCAQTGAKRKSHRFHAQVRSSFLPDLSWSPKEAFYLLKCHIRTQTYPGEIKPKSCCTNTHPHLASQRRCVESPKCSLSKRCKESALMINRLHREQ